MNFHKYIDKTIGISLEVTKERISFNFRQTCEHSHILNISVKVINRYTCLPVYNYGYFIYLILTVRKEKRRTIAIISYVIYIMVFL